MSPTFRARDLAMIATAAATCIVSACATASVGGPVAAPSATMMVATPTAAATAGAGTAGVATAGDATAGFATAGAATVSVPTVDGATATRVPVTSSPSPTGPPTTDTVIPTGPVTQADNGETLRLTVGQQFMVVLAKSPMTWDQPIAQGSAVTRVSATGGYPGSSPALALFHAAAPGTT